MTASLEEARRLADKFATWHDIYDERYILARSHKELDAECERLRTIIEDIQKSKTTTAEHALEAAEAQLRAPVASEEIEALAELEHDQWRTWAQNILAHESISYERRQRWNSLFVPYADLPEAAKELDREWARKTVAMLRQLARAQKG